MALHAALAAAAALISLAFGLCTLERWLDRRRRHEAAWTIALFMFALASIGLWAGAALGWGEWSFKVFYLFGAILNVPFLALGTIYLLAGQRRGDWWAAGISLAAAFSAGIVVAAPLVASVGGEALPRGADVFGPGPRILAAVGSGVAATVILGGALVSAWRLIRKGARPGSPTILSPGRLALANVFIAVGTIILSLGGIFNSVLDEMDAFAVSLVLGISVIFIGFLLTTTPRQRLAVVPWYPDIARMTPTAADDAAAAVSAQGVSAQGVSAQGAA